MSTQVRSPRRYPDLVRTAYLEPLLSGRRVLILAPGGEAGGADDLALERGATAATVASLDPDAIAQHSEGAFDLVVIPDLGAAESPESVLAEAARVLAADGHAVVALPNRDAHGGLSGATPPSFGYYELYDLCASLFSQVKMYGQSPFVGYAVAEFAAGAEDGGISFDASLVGGESEEVEFFVAICGDDAPALDPFSVVQIPLDAVAPREVDGTSDEIEAADRESRAAEVASALEEAQARLEELRSEAGERGIKAQRLEHELHAMEEEAAKARDRAARFAKELDDEKRARQRAELEGQLARKSPELAEAKERADALAIQLEAARARVTAVEKEVAVATEASSAAAADRDALAEELRTSHLERSERTQDETERTALSARLEALQAALDESDRERGEEVDRLERALAARTIDATQARLESDRHRRIAEDLLAELADLRGRADADPAEVTALRESVRGLEVDRDALRDLLDRTTSTLGSERDEAVARALQLQARLLEVEGEAQAARWDASLHESKLAEAGQAVDAGRAAVTALERVLDDERRHAAELEDQVARAREESREAELRAADAEWKKAQAEAWLADLRTQSQTGAGASQGLKMRVAELEQEAAVQARRTAELDEELGAAHGRIAGLEAAAREVRVALDEATRALATERAEQARTREVSEKLVREATERREALDRLLAGLQGEARGYRMRAHEIASERDEARARVAAAEAQRDAAHAVAESAALARAEAEAKPAVPSRTEEDAEHDRGEVRGLRFALAEAHARLADLEAAAWQASAEIGRLKGVLRRERMEADEKLEAAGRELADTRESLQVLRTDADAARSELDRLVSRTSDLGADVERMKDAYRSSEEEIARIRAEASASIADQGRLERAIEERDQRLAAQSDLLREREAALERIAGDLAAAGARLAENEREREKLRAAALEAREAREVAEGADRDAAAEVERLRQETARRDDRIRALTAAEDSAEERAAAAEGKLGAVREALGRLAEEPAASPLIEDLRALLRLLAT